MRRQRKEHKKHVAAGVCVFDVVAASCVVLQLGASGRVPQCLCLKVACLLNDAEQP